MLKPLEQRVDELEDFITEIPHLFNLRMESTVSALHDTGQRISLLDRQVAGLVRDVRDLRGGVTRQLSAQDKEIAEIKAAVVGIETKVGGIEAKVETGFAEILARLPKA